MTISIGKLKDKWNNFPLAAKASMVYAFCSILQKCLSFITLPLFTRILTQEQYGQATIYSSWSGIFSIILTLNLAYGSFPSAMLKFENDRYGYISSVNGISFALSGIFLIIYLPLRKYFNILFDLPTYIIVIMIFEMLALNVINLWSGKKRFEYDYKPIAVVTLSMSVISVISAIITVVLSTEKGYARIAGQGFAHIIFGYSILIICLFKNHHLFNKQYWSYALSFNLPLVIYYLSQTIFNQSDRIMINHYCGKDKAAIYGVAYTLAMILTFVLNAINNSYVPWFYQKIKAGKENDNAKVSTGIAVLMAVFILCIVITAPEIILIMAGKKYYEAIWIIPPVAMSLLLLFYSQLFINVQFYYEQKKKLVYASVGAAVINIILNAVLIPKISYIAAGYTTLISYIVFAVMNYYTMKDVTKKEGFSLDAIDLKALVIIFLVFSIVCFAAMALYKLMIARYLILFFAVIVAVIKRKELMRFVRAVLKR